MIGENGIVGSRLMKRSKTAFARDPMRNWCNHDTAAAAKARLGEDIWGSYARIATARNPYDQEISVYHFRRARKSELPAEKQEIIADFRSFARTGQHPNDEDVVFVDGAFCIQHVIRFENLRDDLECLSKRLGLPIDISQMHHTKKTGSARQGLSIEDYYDDETAAAVRSRRNWAFEALGYSEDWRVQ